MDGIVRQSVVKHEAAMIMDVRNHPSRCPCPLDWAENKEVGRCARLILHPFFNRHGKSQIGARNKVIRGHMDAIVR
jgi:hypothetical protein